MATSGPTETAGVTQEDAKQRQATLARALNSLLWAVGIPVAMVLGAFLAKVTWTWLGVGVMVVVGFLVPALVGSFWNRAGAATLATVAVAALGIGVPHVLHETYAKQYGDKVDALVVDTANYGNSVRGKDRYVCRVVDTSGKVQDLTQLENCHGQFKRRQHIVLYKDPHGFFAPWAEATDGRGFDPIGVPVAIGLFAATFGTVLYGGLRRR
ncbi:hypothetical protein AAHZ94_08260 [Streptomyces sp. HSW2009]|uniref:hypothetical protein n=1 Tax=Streptomyces sp. HSW2009 TaxID=3142890 RepID=UPI0032F068BC